MSRLIYRVLLRCAPREVRRAYSRDMAETFDALYQDAASRGARHVAVLLAREYLSIAAAAGSHRRDAMNGFIKTIVSVVRFRQAARALSRRRAFAAASIVTLALGTAVTTAVFAVVDTVLLKPLPYPSADRLVTVAETLPGRGNRATLIAPGRLADWSRRASAFDAIAGSYVENVTDASGAEPERLLARRVTPGYFDVFGSTPLLGRRFTAEEERFGGPGAAVISEGLWERRYARGETTLESRLVIGGTTYPIVGVMPRAFAPAATEVWLPAAIHPSLMAVRDARFLTGVGRLKPGFTAEQAAQDLAAVQAQLGKEFPSTDSKYSATATDLRTARIGSNARALWMVFGAIGLLWLIGVCNLAGLTLVQLHRRQREFGIRTAIGASRGELIGAIAHEVAIIVSIGGAIGLLIAAWLVGAVPSLFSSLPRLNELTLDMRAVVFAAFSCVTAGLIFGLWPALIAARRSTTAVGATRASIGGAHLTQRALVVAQVALSLLLVGSAGLLVRSYYNLSAVQSGFSSDGVLTFQVGARWDENRDRVGRFQQQLVEALSAMPGVDAVGFTNFLPMSNSAQRARVFVDGITGPEQDGAIPVGTRIVAAGFLKALGIRQIAGTTCGPLFLDESAPRVVLVNQRFADVTGNAVTLVGRQMRVAGGGAPYTIAGVIADVMDDSPQAAPSPYIYTCEPAGAWPDPQYVVRTSDAAGAPAAIRAAVRTLDRSRAIFGLESLDHAVESLRDTPRVNASLLSAFAAASMFLAAIGLYSLFMLLVRERVREIGLRLALGATPVQVVRLVMAGAGRLLAVGVALGLAASIAAREALESVLFGVSGTDPIMLAGAVAILGASAAIAVAIPASRAGRIDPMVAMKAD